MNRQPMMFLMANCLLAVALFTGTVAAQFAAQVVSYDSGTTPTAGYTNAAAALGGPEHFTGEGSFPSVVSPFSPPFLSNELVSIGETGHLTLRLSNYVLPQAVGPEIGVFSNVGLIDADFPNGMAGSPASTFGFDNSVVEVSEDGANWIGLGAFDFDVPANGFTDLIDPFAAVAGSTSSDPQLPFTGDLNSFSGLPYFDAGGPDMLELFAGSAGGKWLDISGTGLAQVGFIRFSVADDGNGATGLNFELDAVSIARAATGSATVPEPGAGICLLAAVCGASVRTTRKSRA